MNKNYAFTRIKKQHYQRRPNLFIIKFESLVLNLGFLIYNTCYKLKAWVFGRYDIDFVTELGIYHWAKRFHHWLNTRPDYVMVFKTSGSLKTISYQPRKRTNIILSQNIPMRIHKWFDHIVWPAHTDTALSLLANRSLQGGWSICLNLCVAKHTQENANFFKVLLLASFGSFDFWSSMVSRNCFSIPKKSFRLP